MRLERQIPIFGQDGQRRISEASVAVAGCGGLGCYVITQLAEAGVGHLTIIDCDSVSESNLNRQFVYSGRSGRKVALMKEWIAGVSPDTVVDAIDERLTDANVDRFLSSADIAVDCLDNNESRLVLNEGAVRKKIPLVHGAVDGLYGQVMTVVPGRTACLDCMLTKDKSAVVPSVGYAVALVASVQTSETIRQILGKGQLDGTMLLMDIENDSVEKVKINNRADCRICGQSKNRQRS